MSTDDTLEIPGFYFDREKNRYYRLLPGHNNHNPLTKENLPKQSTSLQKTEKPKPVCKNDGLAELIKRREIQNITNAKFYMQARENQLCKSEKQSTSTRIKITAYKPYSGFIQSRNPESLFCISNFRSIIHVFDKKHKKFEATKQKEIYCGEQLLSYSQISTRLIATFSVGLNLSNVMLFCDNRIFSLFRVKQTPWSSAWCGYPGEEYRISYSMDEKLVMVPNTIYKRQGLPDGKTTKLSARITAQHFSRSCKLHFNGLLNGSIICKDWSAGMKTVFSFKPPGKTNQKVTDVQMLSDGRRCIARYSSTTDSTKLWDLRWANSPLLEYYCCDVTSVRSLKKFHISSDERILAVDYGKSDSSSLFNISDGRLLACYKGMVSPLYSDCWPMLDGNPGTLGVERNSMVFQPLGSVQNWNNN
ncbi:DDB1- and CUL4-associated factor 4-like [Ciona intestinalis]